MSETTDKFEHWCIVEVMGHTTYAGLVTEQEVGGGSFIRVDVPGTSDTKPFTKLLGHGSIYCITPTDEETARAWALKTCAKAFDAYRAPVLSPPETYNELLEASDVPYKHPRLRGEELTGSGRQNAVGQAKKGRTK